jgi:protein SCO1
MAATLALALAELCCSCGGAAHARGANGGESDGGFDGAALPARAPARNFTLTDQYGRPVSLSSYRGRVVILSFLYPTCGRVCVLIGEQIRGTLDELGGKGVPVLIVSAEPAADSLANVRRYLAQVSLRGRVLYLSGARSQLRPLWRAYHVQPASAGPEAFSSYAGVILIDREGRERVLFEQEELSPEALTHDVYKLERE